MFVSTDIQNTEESIKPGTVRTSLKLKSENVERLRLNSVVQRRDMSVIVDELIETLPVITVTVEN